MKGRWKVRACGPAAPSSASAASWKRCTSASRCGASSRTNPSPCAARRATAAGARATLPRCRAGRGGRGGATGAHLATALHPDDQGARVARLLHVASRCHAGPAVRRDTGVLSRLRAARAGRQRQDLGGRAGRALLSGGDEFHGTTRRAVLGGMAAAGALGSASALSAVAALAPATTGRLKQSVCRWPLRSFALPELSRGAKAVGLAAIDLLHADEWSVVSDCGLSVSMGYPSRRETLIETGFNDPVNHAMLLKE